MADLNSLPYTQRAAEIERQRRYAELLQQQALEPEGTQMVSGIAVRQSPWQNLAKLLQTGLGAYMQKKAGESEAALQKEETEKAKTWFQDLANYAQGKEVTGQTPKTTTVEGFGATGPVPVLNVQDGKFSQAMENQYATPTKAGMLARMMEGMTSDNPEIAKYAGTYGQALMPTEAKYGTPFESGGKMYAMDEKGNVKDLGLAAPTKEPTYQRLTKEWSDKSGNKYKQDYAFNPTTKAMEPIGEAYLADIAPQGTKDDDVKAGATLRHEYNSHPVVQRHSIVASSYQTMLNIPPPDPNDTTGAADMSLIYNYMKMLDPTTGIKEGEYANAQNAGSIPQKIRNLYNNARSGTLLDESQRQNFIKEAKNIYNSSASAEKTVREGILQIGKETGVNPRLYALPEPKRADQGNLPAGFEIQAPQQSTFGSPSGSLMFQFPSGAR